MPTRYFIRWLVIPACILGLWLQPVGAGEEPPATVQEASASQPAEQETPTDEQDAGDDGEEDAPAADTVAGQMGEVSLEEFVPSEEISADGAVSFPVDI